jgi:hypothetical protein
MTGDDFGAFCGRRMCGPTEPSSSMGKGLRKCADWTGAASGLPGLTGRVGKTPTRLIGVVLTWLM